MTTGDRSTLLRKTLPEALGWGFLTLGTILAIAATFIAGATALGAAALIGAGLVLLLVARTDAILEHLRKAQLDRASVSIASAIAAAGRPADADAYLASRRLPGTAPTSPVPHHRTARALLGETVKALNGADAAAPWAIERDGSWSSSDVFDYAVYRRHDGARPARIGIEIHPGPGLDVAEIALGISASYTAGGGLYDGVLVLAAGVDAASSARLTELVHQACGAACVAVEWNGRTTDPHVIEAGILAIAEALEHLTSSPDAAPFTPQQQHVPLQPAAQVRPAAPSQPAAAQGLPAVHRQTAVATEAAQPLAWATAPAAPSTPARTAPLPVADSGVSDFQALLDQASTDYPAPSRRSRSQR